jgi:hypothetical protein
MRFGARCLLLALAVCAGCAPPPRKKAKAPVLAPASATASRAVKLTTTSYDRPNELAPVTDDHPDPEAQRQFEARLGQAALPLLATKEPQRVTAAALDDTRRGEAPNMAAAGDVFAATLAEGQRATLKISLRPTDCVAFIAQGGLGVVEVDLFLTTSDGPSGHILAEDTSVGPIAVIGGRGKCVSGAKGTGTEAVLNVAVRRGAGLVLVRTYARGAAEPPPTGATPASDPKTGP